MRTAGSFLTILGGGVLIVMIYLWSGESAFVLIMSILTLLAAVALYEWRPWAPDEASPLFARSSEPSGKQRTRQVEAKAEAERPPTGDEPEGEQGDPGWIRPEDPESSEYSPDTDHGHTTWRSRFDIGWNEDDLSGLALGDTTPTSWPWSAIDDLGLGLCQAIAEGDIVEERLCLVLQLAKKANPGSPDEAQLMFGAVQDPELVTQRATAAFRASWTSQSPLHSLTAAERTRRLVDALSPTPIALSRETRSPELLYQELRRVLLTNRALRRLSTESQASDVISAVEALLGTHQLPRLDAAEVAEISEHIGTTNRPLQDALDQAAGQRGRRLAFVGTAESDDYLLGLLPAETARHWDGQPVGSGLITVRLQPLD